MHFSPAFILAALPFLAAAKQPLKARQTQSPYVLIAIHSGDQAVHNQPIDASDEYFYIGKNSSASCSSTDSQSPCSAPTQILLGNSTASLDVSVPGGQQIFVTSTGGLSYTPPHSHLIPPGANSTGFQPYTEGGDSASTSGDVTYNLGFGGSPTDWLACPNEQDNVVYYQIFANVTGVEVSGTSITHCHDIAIALVKVDTSQMDPSQEAYQFN